MDHTELDNISLIILVDNIATASVINKGVCIFDKEVDEAIKLLRKRAAKRGIILKAIYIPGENNQQTNLQEGTQSVRQSAL